MRTLIYQNYTSKDGKVPDWAEISIAKFKKYAMGVGAMHLTKFKNTFAHDPHFEYLEIVHDDKYLDFDRILYVDVDVVPERDDNIFDIDMEGYHIAAVPERRYPGHLREPGMQLKGNRNQFQRAAKEHGFDFIQRPEWNNEYLIFNSGVLLWTREGLQQARKTFSPWETWYKQYGGQFRLDQPYLNAQILKHMKYKELEMKWNCMPRIRFEEGTFPDDAVFVHYTSKKKLLIPGIYR